MTGSPDTPPEANQAIDWESRYRDGATGWERAGLNPSFVAWRETGAMAPCRILVPGAGRSPEPLALAEAGFDVTLVDLAATATATQRARLERLHVKAQVHQANLLDWDPPALFDAVYDQACLCALPPAIWADYATRVRRWLRPGGAFFVLFMQSSRAGGPPFHCGLDTMRGLFPATGWVWPEKLSPPVDHSPGLAEQPAVLHAR
jgi:hypothetical protein